MSEPTAEASDAVTVQVMPGPDDDAQLLEELAGLLQEELLELDVAAVEPVSEEAVRGTKGVPADIVGWLSVFLGSGGLAPVINAVAAFAKRSQKSVELTCGGDTLKLNGTSKQQMDKALDEWFARHPAGA